MGEYLTDRLTDEAMVESVDDSVGRVMAKRKELKLDNNTLVIFTVDNGGFYNATSNAPMRANKGAYYEGGIRVPLIIKWPGAFQAGRVVNEHPFSVPSIVIRKGSWKLIQTFDPEGIELYNLADDLSETKNLAATETAKVKELQAELNAWRTEVGAELMRPNRDYDPSAATPTKKKTKKDKYRSGLRQKSLSRSGLRQKSLSRSPSSHKTF